MIFEKLKNKKRSKNCKVENRIYEKEELMFRLCKRKLLVNEIQ